MATNSTSPLSLQLQSVFILLDETVSIIGAEVAGLLGPILVETVAFGEYLDEVLSFRAENLVGAFSLLIILMSFVILLVSSLYGQILQADSLILTPRRDGLNNRWRILMGSTCIVMYTMAAVHWGLAIQAIFAYDKITGVARDNVSSYIKSGVLHGEFLSDPNLYPSSRLVSASACGQTILLTINVSIDHSQR
jgi:hypothetical protein